MTEPDAPPAADPSPAAIEPPAEVPPSHSSPQAQVPPAPEAPLRPPSDPELAQRSEPPVPRPPSNVLPWLCGLGFLVLAGAIGFVWWSAQQPQSLATSDLQPLEGRVAQLEQRVAAQRGGAADLGPLSARVAALEQRPVPDLARLEASVAALEKQATDTSRFVARLDALSGRVDALAGRVQNAEDGIGHRIEANETRLAALERTSAQMAATVAQAARLARIQAAQAALATGRPLGELPDAPPAVARFATTGPPTEAALRLAFPKVEHAALEADHADADTRPLVVRLLAQTGMVVRQGDHVVIGDEAAGALARAQTALNAGDLAGAVAVVSGLSGPPAAAMAGWLADAKALLAARAGLTDMVAHG